MPIEEAPAVALEAELAEVARLKDRMLKKPYFMMTRSVIAASRLKPAMLDHYRWIIAVEKAGKLFLSGPVTERDGGQGAGVTIFDVDSWDEAEALANSDPFCLSGAVSFRLQMWQLNEGRLTFSFDLSDQRFRLG